MWGKGFGIGAGASAPVALAVAVAVVKGTDCSNGPAPDPNITPEAAGAQETPGAAALGAAHAGCQRIRGGSGVAGSPISGSRVRPTRNLTQPLSPGGIAARPAKVAVVSSRRITRGGPVEEQTWFTTRCCGHPLALPVFQMPPVCWLVGARPHTTRRREAATMTPRARHSLQNRSQNAGPALRGTTCAQCLMPPDSPCPQQKARLKLGGGADAARPRGLLNWPEERSKWRAASRRALSDASPPPSRRAKSATSDRQRSPACCSSCSLPAGAAGGVGPGCMCLNLCL